MRFQGSVTVKASREKVWAFLTDPQSVSSCAPGLESCEVEEPGKSFRAVGALAIGSVKPRFTTRVEWVDLAPPHRASMKFHGTSPGSAVDGKTSMILSEGSPGTTELAWEADIAVIGTIASVAARLMDEVVRRLTGQFFAALQRKIEARKKTLESH